MLPAGSISGDRTKICPYDPGHVILAKSFNAHLIKCRENHKDIKLSVCPMDKTHVVPRPELAHHLEECKKTSLLDRELQKRAGDNILKGDVTGPAIVGDRWAGQETEDTENWDDAPASSAPTPALFNQKVKKTPNESDGNIPGGGYMPPAPEEPKIRKVPNHPAQAATLSNPGASQVRPTHNQVYEFSIGRARMLRPDSNPPRPSSSSLQAMGPRGAVGMTQMRAPAPMPGPRFSGRGVAKYATKNNSPGKPARTATSPRGSPRLMASPTKTGEAATAAPPTAPQFEDASLNNQNPALPMRQDAAYSLPLTDNVNGNGTLGRDKLESLQPLLLKHSEQLGKLKAKHSAQKLEWTRKFEDQMKQLQEAQALEMAKVKQKHDKEEAEFCNKAVQEMMMSLSLDNNPDAMQSAISPSLQDLQSMMAVDGNQLSGLLSSMSYIDSQGAASIEVPSASSGMLEDVQQESSPAGTLDLNGASGLDIPDSEEISNSNSVSISQATPTQADLQKTISNLKNTLREIEIIEQKSMLGHVLSKTEEAKLESKESALKQLKALQPSESDQQ